VLSAAQDIGEVADTLRREVEQFLRTMGQDDSERRRYERVSANGMQAALSVGSKPPIATVILDISRSGAALETSFRGEIGGSVKVTVKGMPDPISARIVRNTGSFIALVFNQDEQTLRMVDAVLDRLAAAQPARLAA
jgi:methyl-accepting chemotaxis protein